MAHLGAVPPEARAGPLLFTSKHSSHWQVTLWICLSQVQTGQEQGEFLATSGWEHPFTSCENLGSKSLLWIVPGSLLVYVTLQNITAGAHFCSPQESPRTHPLSICAPSLPSVCSTKRKPLALDLSKKDLRPISPLLSTFWRPYPGKGWRSKRNFQIPVGQRTFQFSRTLPYQWSKAFVDDVWVS